MSEWISVKDRLPPIDNEFGTSAVVLLCDMFGDMISAWYQYDCEYVKDKASEGYAIGWHSSFACTPDETLTCITHWMPLPPPPED